MILAVTPGDPDGIGPEIVWKVLQSEVFRKSQTRLLCVGAAHPFIQLGAPVISIPSLKEGLVYPKNKTSPFVWLLPAPTTETPKNTCLPGFQAGWSIEQATRLVLNKTAAALVTGPISKTRLNQGGFKFPGHTEFLAHLCTTQKKQGAPKIPEVTMLLANQYLKVSLVTIHIGLKDIPSKLSQSSIERAILQTYEGLRSLWRIQRPRIAIAALNPHAGEAGQFGQEEIKIIQPTVSFLQKKLEGLCTLIGPLPSDTLFARHHLAFPQGLYDAVVCLYHDQGLIPVKLLDFHQTVNVTLGLPFIRTSVDHGVGFDIVGKNIANPSSLLAAIQLAEEFVKNKREHT